MGAPNSLSGRGWVTVFDHDFTADTSQTLSPDGLYSIGGFQWQKENSANDAVAMNVTNGTGLIVQPVANTTYDHTTRTLPLIWLPLTGIPELQQLDWGSSLRLWTHIASSNAAANFDDASMGLDSNATGALGFQALRGIGTAATQTFSLQQYVNQASITNGAGAGFQSGNTIVPGGSNNVVVLNIPVIGGAGCQLMYGGFGLAAGKTWPDPQDLLMGVVSISSTANSYAGFIATGPLSWNFPVSQLGIFLGARRANSATALNITYGHVRLDVKL